MKEIVSDFGWAENKIKLQRAINKAKIDTNTDGTEYTEEAIMEWYVKLGGNVVGKITKKGKNADKIVDKDTEE